MCVHSKQSTMNYYFPEEVLEHVFDYLPSYADRNTVSLVCKFWYDVERFSRKKVFVVNCYAISPERVIARFPRLTSLALNGKPDAFVFTLIPPDWGGFVKPWIEMMVSNGVNLEELNLKRMVVSDESLELLSRSFPNFKSLVMFRCQSFSSDGLASIASNCRSLRVLDLQENDVDDIKGHWLSCFPNSCTTLVSLNFSCLKGEVNSEALERLVARCPNLVCLRLNYSVPLDILQRILVQAPQLVDLGVGSFVSDPVSETYNKLMNALQRCTSITSLSGFLSGVSVSCLPAFYPICQGLTSLDFSYSPIQGSTVWQLICHCRKLECLWVQDTIGDLGLAIVASTCKELHELRIFRNNRHMMMQHFGVTEEGLIVLSAGCPKLKTLLYMCERMTNVALMTLAKNCPGLVTFILQSRNPEMVDVATMQTFDEGFGVVVQSCKGLKRLGLSGVLTDQVFLYIGMYAEQLEMLSIPFVGENSDSGMLYVLNGCKKLKELNIMNSPFGDVELLADMSKYETIRCLCMLSCQVTLGACKELAQQMPRLNVETVGPNEMLGLNMEIPSPDDRDPIKKIYVYRTLAGPRKDAPGYVQIL